SKASMMPAHWSFISAIQVSASEHTQPPLASGLAMASRGEPYPECTLSPHVVTVVFAVSSVARNRLGSVLSSVSSGVIVFPRPMVVFGRQPTDRSGRRQADVAPTGHARWSAGTAREAVVRYARGQHPGPVSSIGGRTDEGDIPMVQARIEDLY